MIFNSVAFGILFFVTALVIYFLPAKSRWIWLLLTGVFFYGWSNPVYILVPAFIILVTWFAGFQIEKAATEKKATLYYLLGVAANVGILVFFKYSNFFTSAAVDLANFFSQKVFHS